MAGKGYNGRQISPNRLSRMAKRKLSTAGSSSNTNREGNGRPAVSGGQPNSLAATRPFSSVSLWQVIAICILLFLLVAWAFLPSAQNGFADYDDDVYVTANPHVQSGLTLAGEGRTDETISHQPLSGGLEAQARLRRRAQEPGRGAGHERRPDEAITRRHEALRAVNLYCRLEARRRDRHQLAAPRKTSALASRAPVAGSGTSRNTKSVTTRRVEGLPRGGTGVSVDRENAKVVPARSGDGVT